MTTLALAFLTVAVLILATNIVVALGRWRRGDGGLLVVSTVVTAVALVVVWWLLK